jgi:hypothetical protein
VFSRTDKISQSHFSIFIISGFIFKRQFLTTTNSNQNKMPPRKKIRESPKQNPTPMEVENDNEENANVEQAQVSVASRGFHAEGAKNNVFSVWKWVGICNIYFF